MEFSILLGSLRPFFGLRRETNKALNGLFLSAIDVFEDIC